MDPVLLSSLLEESNIRNMVRETAVHLLVKPNSKLKNLIDFGTKKIKAGECEQLFCWGHPGAVGKTVSCVEYLKTIWLDHLTSTTNPPSKPHSLLNQCSRIFVHPIETKVETFLVKSNKPALVVVLSPNQLIHGDNAVASTSAGEPVTSKISLPGADAPATEVPPVSRRRERHIKKRKRVHPELNPICPPSSSSSGPPTKKTKKSKRKRGPPPSSHEKPVELCQRLDPAFKISQAAVDFLKNSKQQI